MELELIQNRIFELRGYKVMPDFHLAEMYEVETKVSFSFERKKIIHC